MAQKDIKYINKDFNSLKQALIEYAKNYFPEVYNDFTEATPGNMFIEMASYVGDVLSFYVDKQTQENFLLFAQDKKNLISMAYTLGYRPKVVSTAVADISIFQQLPAVINGGVASPDYSYSMIIDKEAKIKSFTNSDTVFITDDIVDFMRKYNDGKIQVIEFICDTSINPKVKGAMVVAGAGTPFDNLSYNNIVPLVYKT
jgi:hypothetical protein